VSVDCDCSSESESVQKIGVKKEGKAHIVQRRILLDLALLSSLLQLVNHTNSSLPFPYPQCSSV